MVHCVRHHLHSDLLGGRFCPTQVGRNVSAEIINMVEATPQSQSASPDDKVALIWQAMDYAAYLAGSEENHVYEYHDSSYLTNLLNQLVPLSYEYAIMADVLAGDIRR